MKYFIIAGEASGDLHGAALMHELKKRDESAEFWFFGGDQMKAEGGKLVKHIQELAFMGFWTVLKNIFIIIKNFKTAKSAMKLFQPDVVLLIDYPGFNLRMANYVRKKIKVPVYYYISPTVWAWNKSRVKQIKRNVNYMLTIIPFETEFYAKYGYQVHYVGNPTVDSIDKYLNKSEDIKYFKRKYFLSDKPIIALLPGSRKQEIAACLPKMLEAAKRFPDYQIVISGTSGISIAFYHEFLEGISYQIIVQETYQLIFHADIAIVNSGTATLETALIGTPQVVVYHVMCGRLAYWLKELVLKTKYIALVNILSKKEVVKELYAHLFTTENLENEMERILRDQTYRERMLHSYDQLGKELKEPGTAQRAAAFIIDKQKKNNEGESNTNSVTKNT